MLLDAGVTVHISWANTKIIVVEKVLLVSLDIDSGKVADSVHTMVRLYLVL